MAMASASSTSRIAFPFWNQLSPPPPLASTKFRTIGVRSGPRPRLLSFSVTRQEVKKATPKYLILGAAYISPPADIVEAHDTRDNDGDNDNGNGIAEPAVPISWSVIGKLLLAHKLGLALSVLALFASTACTLSMPIFSGKLFEILIGSSSEHLWGLLGKMGLLYLLEPIFTIIFVTNMSTIWEKVMATLRSEIFKRILIQKVEFFDRHKVGELTGLLTSDLGSLKDIVNENISRDRGFRAFSELVGTLVILFSLSAQLAPLLGVLILSVSILVALYKRTTVPIFKAHGQTYSRISDCAAETFSAIRTVRSFGGEMKQMSMFTEQVLAYQRNGMKLGWLKSTNESLTRVMVYISLMALYSIGGRKVKMGELSVGTMASFIGYTFTLTFAVQGFVNTLGDFRGTLAAVDRINSVIGRTEIDESLAYGLKREAQSRNFTAGEYVDVDQDRITDDGYGTNFKIRHFMSGLKSKSSIREHAWSGDVSLEDVSFSYPLRPDVQVLNGLSLTLNRGSITALVGASGAGKSTIVQLLARFYEPTQGRITIAGEDARMFDKTEWARAVSIVNQEPVLFAMTLAENIAYGLPNEHIAQEDIVLAAKAANAHDFIIALPQGYDTLVGERGSLLSGGQRQRVAIARALLKNAPILILDEATSSLDVVSEQLVQEALYHLMEGRTTLVIAHRLSTVQNANQIALVSEGKVAELGSHLELLAQGGLYASLVDTQRLGFK
ncbi:hypothetical protein KI387_020411 [Taxus chinensis]|uniref:ABC transporter B family member 28 n=1 Tax=Taxus chinensis TaxID=29808 RepID=A0AA38G8V8_TAXCH|nr:hypothetical protein KI387_020411 [Taxus chinensis]